MDSSGNALKWTAYVLLAVATVLIQTTIIQRIYVFDVHPFVIPILLTCVSIHENPLGSAVYGFFLGLLCDTFISPSGVFYAVAFMLAAFVISGLCRFMFKKNLLISALISLVCLAAASTLYFLLFFLLPGKAGPMALVSVTLPETLISLPAVLLLYFPVRAVSLRFN